ncbi:MAG: histidinol-phosphatase [Clostridia bacterium]|nr:histidinol-phosphatase [Clostridia bacterium]
MKANYHTHTVYCGHSADDSVEEYVKVAVERGLDTLGFACHVPYIFADGFLSDIRIQLEDHEKYVRDVLEAKEKYKSDINILLGYEAEYYPRHFEEMLENIKKYPVDYLILGQHFSNNEYDGECNHEPTPDIRRIEDYADTLCRAMMTGKFTYIAHPDLLTYMGSEDEYLCAMSPVCRVAAETDTPLEINLLGLTDGRGYPREGFFKLAKTYGCRFILGCDAHRPSRVARPKEVKMGLDFIREAGLSVIDHAELKKV